MINIKRVYEPAANEDGRRFLIERLWPRGFKKENLKADMWLKDLGASSKLRKWFGHNTTKWKEFQKRYFKELKNKSELLKYIKDACRRGNVTLLFSAKDTEHNNAVALKNYLEEDKS